MRFGLPIIVAVIAVMFMTVITRTAYLAGERSALLTQTESEFNAYVQITERIMANDPNLDFSDNDAVLCELYRLAGTTPDDPSQCSNLSTDR